MYFVSPVVKGMRRAKPPKERARQRVLSDLELRLMWPILDEMGTYGAAVKCMLLTAQRARKVAQMRRGEIVDGVPPDSSSSGPALDRVWDPTRDDDPDNKQVSMVPLATQAQAIIAAVPVIDAENGADYVLGLNGRQPLNGWSKLKARLDRHLLASLRMHDPARWSWNRGSCGTCAAPLGP